MWTIERYSHLFGKEKLPEIANFSHIHGGKWHNKEECYTIVWKKDDINRYVFDENLNFVGITEFFFKKETRCDFKYHINDSSDDDYYLWKHGENLEEIRCKEVWNKYDIVYWSVIELFNESSIEIVRKEVSDEYDDDSDDKFKKTHYWLMDKSLTIMGNDYYFHFGEQWILNNFFAVANENGKFGYVNSKGKLVVDYQFDGGNIDTDWISHPNYDLVYVKNEIGDYLYGVVDWNGKLIIEQKYKDISIHDEYICDFNPQNEEHKKHKKERDYIELKEFDNSIRVWKYNNQLLSKFG